jgi:hypothetical protein
MLSKPPLAAAATSSHSGITATKLSERAQKMKTKVKNNLAIGLLV